MCVPAFEKSTITWNTRKEGKGHQKVKHDKAIGDRKEIKLKLMEKSSCYRKESYLVNIKIITSNCFDLSKLENYWLVSYLVRKEYPF